MRSIPKTRRYFSHVPLLIFFIISNEIEEIVDNFLKITGLIYLEVHFFPVTKSRFHNAFAVRNSVKLKSIFMNWHFVSNMVEDIYLKIAQSKKDSQICEFL